MFKRKNKSISLLTLLVFPLTFFNMSNALAELEPGERCFTITGYYSALPPDQQRIYSNGGSGEEAHQKELRLNGQGLHTADGTPPYVGVVAAPRLYPFNTKIGLNGIGTFTVRDRGGAIVPSGERGYSCDRIDIYTGSGEEGLAKALHIGKRTVQGQVYAPEEQVQEGVDLSWLSSQLPVRLLNAISQINSTVISPSSSPAPHQVTPTPFESPLVNNERSLEEKLKSLGYAANDLVRFQVDHAVIPTANSFGAGVYGPLTQAAMALALQNPSSKPIDPPQVLVKVEAQAPLQERESLKDKEQLKPGLYAGVQGQAVESLQRALWQLNLYHESITGHYDEATKAAVFEFQRTKGVVASHTLPGAGVYGPKTHETLQLTLEERAKKINVYPQELKAWIPKRESLPALNELTLPESVHAPMILNFNLGAKAFDLDPLEPYRHLAIGSKGEEVVHLQRVLVEKGLLPQGLDTGYYGEVTAEAVLKFKF